MQSMTAFADLETDTQHGRLCCEMKSVNQRFLDISLKMPDFLRNQEVTIQESIKRKLSRGKVTLYIRFFPSKNTQLSQLSVNQPLLQQLSQCADKISGQLALKNNDLSVSQLLNYPDVIVQSPIDMSDLQDDALQLIVQLTDELIASRKREGEAMQQILREKIAFVKQKVAELEQQMPEINRNLEAKMRQKLDDLNITVNPERFEQELTFYLQKIDVGEELDRLNAHVKEFNRTLEIDQPIGRRLDFLIQEMNRESNTIGSKSASIVSSNAAIELKVTIEQMREQIQNIE